MKPILKLYRDVVGWLFSDMQKPVYWWKAIVIGFEKRLKYQGESKQQ